MQAEGNIIFELGDSINASGERIDSIELAKLVAITGTENTDTRQLGLEMFQQLEANARREYRHGQYLQ